MRHTPALSFVALAVAALLVGSLALAQRGPAPLNLVGQLAPRVVLQLHDGSVLDTRTLAGRPYILDFWAPACAPCLGMVPRLNAAHRRLARSNAMVIGYVGATVTPREHMRVRRAWRINYPTGTPFYGADEGNAYGVYRLPAMFAVGADGRIVYDSNTLEFTVRLDDAVSRLLAPPGAAVAPR